MLPCLLLHACLTMAQPGPGEVPALEGMAFRPDEVRSTPLEIQAPLLASPSQPPPPQEERKKPPVFPPTYSIGPTPFGDFTGPSFGSSTPDRFPLMLGLQGTWIGWLLDGNRTQLTGWTEVSYNASSARHDNRPTGFDYRANELVVQQNVLRLDRPADTGSKHFDWGGRVDLMLPGTDYFYTLQRGLFFGQLADSKQVYGIDPVQFYVDLWFPEVAQGTTLRIGRFTAHGGVESALAISNILFSHSYINIFTPFTTTGALTTTKLSDQWYVQYGLALGSDVFIDPTDQPTFLGGIRWVSANKKDSLFFSTCASGGNYFANRRRDNVQVFDLVYTHVFTPRFQTITEMLFAYQTSVPNLDTITWYGIDTFFQYDFSDQVYGAIRPEIWVDSQGQRTGFKGLYTTLTAGITYKPRNWIFLRPELRFDHFYGTSGPYEGKHNLFTIAQDVIFRW